MSDVVHRSTGRVIRSVNTPDFDPAVWIILPDRKACEVIEAIPQKYRAVFGDKVREMEPDEKINADAGEAKRRADSEESRLRSLKADVVAADALPERV